MVKIRLPKAVLIGGDVDRFVNGKPKYPLIVVLGPTASGKTKLSLVLAEYLASKFHKTAEIINADSRQFYIGMDIGTAKVTKTEMQGTEHHLFSVLNPDEKCSIGWYQKQATLVIGQIHRRGNIPLLVGGSMLYLSSIIDGLKPVVSADKKLRESLSKAYDRDQGRSLHERLMKVDPDSAASIPRQNKIYLIRALEIYEGTGQPKSRVLKKFRCKYDLLMIGIDVEREILRKRIKNRTVKMFADGWVEEVKKLLRKGYGSDDPGMISTGYKEIIKSLENGSDPIGNMNKIIVQTCQYAKRQMTWWRRDTRIRWISEKV